MTEPIFDHTPHQLPTSAKRVYWMLERRTKFQSLKAGDLVVESYMLGKKRQYRLVPGSKHIKQKLEVLGHDAYGFTWAAPIGASGRKGTPECLEAGECDYAIADEQIDAILLGGVYDPKKELRALAKERRAVRAYNKRHSFQFGSQSELETWWKNNLVDGMDIWISFQRSRDIEWTRHTVVGLEHRSNGVIFGDIPFMVLIAAEHDSSWKSTFYSDSSWGHTRFMLIPPKTIKDDAK